VNAPEEITIDRVVRARAAGSLTDSSYRKLLTDLLSPPTPENWLQNVRHWFLVAGLLLLVSGVIYFGAYNWEHLGRLQKLGLLQAILITLFSGIFLRGLRSTEGRVLLFAAGVIVGGLLAVLGQVYQTGADSFFLFLGWSVLLLPWCVAGRFNELWVLELAILETAFTLWWYQRVDDDFMSYSLAFLVLNLILFGVWERARKSQAWMSSHPSELLLFAGLTPVTLSSCAFLIDWEEGGLCLLALAAVLAALFNLRGGRLITMATVAASLFCICTTFFGRLFLEMEEPGVLFLGIAIMVEVALIVKWLTWLNKKTHPGSSSKDEATSATLVSDLPEEELKALTDAGDLPWYIQVLVGFGAWFASLFVLIFFLLIIMNSEGALCFLGALMYGGTLYFRNRAEPPLFLRHALLSTHLAGVMTASAGVAEISRDVDLGFLVAGLLFAASARFYQDGLGGFLFGFGFAWSGLFAAAEAFGRPGGTLWILLLMVLVLLFSNKLDKLLQSFLKAHTLPVYRGLATGLLATALAHSFDNLPLEYKIALSVLAVAVSVWESHLLKHPNLAKLGLLLVGALINSVPALIISIFVYLTGFQTRQRFVQGLALASVAASVTFYYYNLDLSLMAKSLALVGGGVALLVLRVLLGLQNVVVEEEDSLAL
ncbi:MAG: DUF4401 domain-containing protein, partial [Candidatus Eremiobacteraeota bacterium]|nr:DUF4401 domain-containing protein [Candidatus Eremiobacteraeota bacterium]